MAVTKKRKVGTIAGRNIYGVESIELVGPTFRMTL